MNYCVIITFVDPWRGCCKQRV